MRATSFPRPSHILYAFSSEPPQNARPSILFFKCALIYRLKTFLKNPATLGKKIYKDLHILGLCFDLLILTYDVIHHFVLKQIFSA